MTVSQIYSLYINNKLIVNRKYQRKLCWTIEEKRNFIDTIENGMPVPLFLFAVTEKGQYEIIDGMQRLDAICTFISQKYKLKDGFFNLESMPDTIEQKRRKKLNQSKPIIDSTICQNFANYPLPVSVFPNDDNKVEEIFKRINSTGKHLSNQELRQIGVSTQFATLVRQISSEIRGDISEEVLLLNNMSNISLSNYRLKYSIFIPDIFWVNNEIIRSDEMRLSRDEEAVAYIICNMILPDKEKINFTTEKLNKLYGYSRNPLDKTEPLEMTQINNAIDRVGVETIKKQFRSVYSCVVEMTNMAQTSLRKMLNVSNQFNDLIIPFQILFMAIYKLIVKENLTSINYDILVKQISCNCIDYRAAQKDSVKRDNAIHSVYGLIKDAFSKGDSEDPSKDDWTMELINILNKSRTEQTLYDFKIGFVPLNEKKIDYKIVDRVLKTLASINNGGPNRVGYVIIGVADKLEDAQKYNVDYKLINELPLCGIEHDVSALSTNIDKYTHTIKEYIRNCSLIPDQYRMHLLSHMKVICAYNKHTIVFKTCYNEPVPFNNEYYLREFSDVNKLTSEEIPTLFKNYYNP